MATGGYKLATFTWQGGRTDSVLDRTNFVLTGICQALISAGTGWSVDTSYITDINDYKKLNTQGSGSDYNAIVKFLKNTNNTRLAIGYCSKSYVSFPDNDCFHNSSSSNYCKPVGLFCSVMPDGDAWNITSAGSGYQITLTNTSTRWIGGGMGGTNTSPSFVSDNTYTYTYHILSKNNQLIFLLRSSNWNAGNHRGFVLGEIFGSLAHSTDTSDCAKFGCISLSDIRSYETSEPSTSSSYQSGINSESSYWNTSYGFVQFYRADTSSKPPIQYDTGSLVPTSTICNQEQFDSGITAPALTGGGRWTPIQCYLKSSDPSLYGIVSGDGFKGYLDTDFMRGVVRNVYSRGQTLGANQEFIYLGGGIAVGWDSSNTGSIF